MLGTKWAIYHTFLTLIGKKKYLLDGTIGSYTSKWALVRTIWQWRTAERNVEARYKK